MAIKKPTNQNAKNDKKLNWSNLGSAFPSRKGDKLFFKPKLDKYGVKSIDVTLNNGDIVTLDDTTLVMFTPKEIKTKNGNMEIIEVSMGV